MTLRSARPHTPDRASKAKQVKDALSVARGPSPGRHTRPRSPALPAALLLVAAFAGCGSTGSGIASKTPAQALAAARTAAVHASSVHLASDLHEGRVRSMVDAELASNGGHAQVSLLGLTYEVIRIGDTIYLKGTPAFDARLSRSIGLRIPQGRWLKGPADSGPLARFAGITQLTRELILQLRTAGPLTKGTTTTIDGQKAIQIKDSGKLYAGSLYLAAVGQPYPLQIARHGRESGQTTFTGWNKPVTLTAPADAVELPG